MGIRRAFCLLALGALVVSGCGGGDNAGSTTGKTPAKPRTAAPARALFRPGDLEGYRPTSAARVIRDPGAMGLFDNDPTEAPALVRERFIDGTVQSFAGRGGDRGYTSVQRFRTEEGARAEMERVAGTLTADPDFTGRFEPPAVPGSVGYSLGGGGGTARNLYVARGSTLWFIGFSATTRTAPSEGALGRAFARVLRRATGA